MAKRTISRPRANSILILVSRDEKERLHARAKRDGLNLSEFIRRLAYSPEIPVWPEAATRPTDPEKAQDVGKGTE